MISKSDLDFWVKNNLNVLFVGKAGCGKTSLILETFKEHNLKYQYFSAATMDPWVDFIGIPKEVKGEDGQPYLDLIRPRHFQYDEVEAIFLDEYNRSKAKIRNAVMELIQFKSINGKKFNNLRIIWAAINPDDGDDQKYDVEALDPAQIDRFHIKVEMPYMPDSRYFKNKYGEDTATTAITWWKELTKEQKNIISPRRLDYALDIHTKGGNLRHVMPGSVNITKLIFELSNGSVSKEFNALLNGTDTEAFKAFLADQNKYAIAKDYILKEEKTIKKVLPLLSEEQAVSLVCKQQKVQKLVFATPAEYKSLIELLAQKATNQSVLKEAKKAVAQLNPSFSAYTGQTVPISKVTDIDKCNILTVGSVQWPNSAPRIFNGMNISNTYHRAQTAEDIIKHIKYYSLDEPHATSALQVLANLLLSLQVGGYGSVFSQSMKVETVSAYNTCIRWLIANNISIPLSALTMKKIHKKWHNAMPDKYGFTRICVPNVS